MKERTKEILRDGFGSLVNNASAMRGAKNGPLWLTIVMFLLSLLLPVIPLFVAQAKVNGSSFMSTYSYGLEKTVTSVALDLKNNRNVEFLIGEDHLLSITEEGKAIDYNNYGSARPFASYVNEVSHQYDFLLFVSDAKTSADKKAVNNTITSTKYVIGDVTQTANLENVYIPSYMVLYPDTLYVSIYKNNSADVLTSSYNGDYKTMKVTTTGLSDFLTVTDKDGNVVAQDITNNEYTDGVLVNFKKVMDRSYDKLKIRNMWGTSGIYLAIFFGLVILMGFLMWLLTRGKNNPNNYFSIWLTMQVSARLAVSPAIITLIVGFFLTKYAPIIFILTMGLRVMWISMKELRPVQA